MYQTLGSTLALKTVKIIFNDTIRLSKNRVICCSSTKITKPARKTAQINSKKNQKLSISLQPSEAFVQENGWLSVNAKSFCHCSLLYFQIFLEKPVHSATSEGSRSETPPDQLQREGILTWPCKSRVLRFYFSYSFLQLFLFLLSVSYVWVFWLHKCLYAMCMLGVQGGKKRESEALELKLQEVVRC